MHAARGAAARALGPRDVRVATEVARPPGVRGRRHVQPQLAAWLEVGRHRPELERDLPARRATDARLACLGLGFGFGFGLGLGLGLG